ncbi:Na(+)/H(+) antiporter subunit F1 [Bacillus solimangrovi]|uniref:Na(+)/H(+) antiporter subunit F n=1 Tax=Bacillus solimangrovi TaxID=1305675 RepID=A0A1E5LHW7_9BACI|nr:Na(+)/H(+) antiporter subunit F1 [Bacillus solimangrovi]OEH93665.1 Na(+)/H(+) antiporter subunit F [Bacillus solimangrovi]
MSDLLSIVIDICSIVIAISLVMLLYRAVKGPTNPDRAVALDTIGINLIALTGLMAIKVETIKFNDIILLIGILSFIGTVATAKFLEKGVIIERDNH